MRVHVTFASGDDWEALYINGRLVHQTHSVPRFILSAQLVGNLVESWSGFEVDYRWLEVQGEFPVNLSDIPMEVRK